MHVDGPPDDLPAAIDRLADELDPAAILRPGDDLDAYERPARGTGGPAAAVVRPADVEEVRVAIGWARRHRVHLLPQGANTGLGGASVPPPVGGRVVVLSTDRLTAGLEVHADDRAAVAPAGIRRSALDEAAAPHGLWLPIDLAADPALGGMVATNTGGARMLRHGDVRRRLLGLRVVVADDDRSVLEDLTTLRKDNTGPSVASWFVGSCGALGVITHVAVELDHLPAERAAAFVAPADGRAAIRLLAALESGLGPLLSAFEVMSAEAVRAALDTVDGLHAPFPGPVPGLVVLAEADGPEGTADVLARVVAGLPDDEVADAVVAPPERAWAVRHAITEGLARTGVVVGFDVSVSRSEMVAFLEDARRLVHAALPRATVADFGHWGDGGVHCNLVFPADDPPTDDERSTARELVFGCAVDDHRGSYSAEHGIGPHNADWWRRVTPAANRRAIRSLRDRFDPDRVLGHPDLPF